MPCSFWWHFGGTSDALESRNEASSGGIARDLDLVVPQLIMVPDLSKQRIRSQTLRLRWLNCLKGRGDFVVGAGQVSPRVRCVIGIPVIEMTVKNPSP